jgi:signal transduction histidine kinase/CheY-like chemotaxis protein
MSSSFVKMFDLSQVEDISSFPLACIQSFGAVLAIRPPASFLLDDGSQQFLQEDISAAYLDSFCVTHVSENIDVILGRAVGLMEGQRWILWMDEVDVREILSLWRQRHPNQIYVHHILISSVARSCPVSTVMHMTTSGHLLIDLIPSSHPIQPTIASSSLSASGLARYCDILDPTPLSFLATSDNLYRDAQRAVEKVNSSMVYDRLTMLRQLPFEQGEIMAESIRNDITVSLSHMGERLHTSTLAPDTLEQYIRWGVRVVADVQSKTIPLICLDEEKDSSSSSCVTTPSFVTLNQSFLRPISPAYLQKLRLLNVRSAMVCLIPAPSDPAASDREPVHMSTSQWGALFMYHRSESRHFSWNERTYMMEVASLLARAAVHEQHLSQQKQQEQLDSMSARFETVTAKPEDKCDLLHQLMCGHPDLCEMVGCSSIAFYCGDMWLRVGGCPSLSWLRNFASYLGRRCATEDLLKIDQPRVVIFSSSDATRDLDNLADIHSHLPHDIDGYLCGLVSLDPLICIFCFRHNSYLETPTRLEHSSSFEQGSRDSSPGCNRRTPVSDTIPFMEAQSNSCSPPTSSVNSALFSDATLRTMFCKEWPVNAVPMMRVVVRHIQQHLELRHGDVQFLQDEIRTLMNETAKPHTELASVLLREYMDGILVVLRKRAMTPGSKNGDECRPAAFNDEKEDPSVVAPMDTILCVNQGYVRVFGFPGETADCDDGDIECTLLNAGVPLEGLIDAEHNTQRKIKVWSKEKGLRTLHMYYRHVLNIYCDNAHHEILSMCFYDVTQSERTRISLRVSQAQAVQLGLAKQQLIGMVSHELRTPLHAILGFSGQISTEFAGRMDVQLQEYVHDIHNAGSHLLNIITNLLDLTKSETANITAVNVSSVITEVCSWVQATCAAKSQQLSVRSSDAIMFVRVDAVSLRRIIVNLLDNAVKFTPPKGSITVSALFVPPVTLSSNAGFVQISVEDGGIGMAADVLPKIFNLFYQANLTNQREYGGAGLGLAMVKRLVEQMNGTIDVNSVLGKGSKFTITLPLTTLSEEEQVQTTTTAMNATAFSGISSPPCFPLPDPELHTVKVFSPSPVSSVQLPHPLGALSSSSSTSSPMFSLDAELSTAIDGDFIPLPVLQTEAALLAAVEASPDVIHHDTISLSHLAVAAPVSETVKSPIALLRTIIPVTTESPPPGLTAASSAATTASLSTQGEQAVTLKLSPSSLLMLVDDSPINLKLCQRMLVSQGYSRFETAENGLQALERLIFLRSTTGMPAVLFLDLHMPFMDGFETCKHLRKLGFTLPICALTAATGLDAKQKCEQVGFTCMLIKPVSRVQLQEAIALMFAQ